MALHGEGEPQASAFQRATQALTIALFEQWQTYNNGVHMDYDTFRSIDFENLARAAYGPVSEWVRENGESDEDKPVDTNLNYYDKLVQIRDELKLFISDVKDREEVNGYWVAKRLGTIRDL